MAGLSTQLWTARSSSDANQPCGKEADSSRRNAVGLSMVITVKNERALLRDNLLYHHFVGVDHFYVYSDGGTDGTIESVCDLPYVMTADSVPPSLFAADEACRDKRGAT